MPRVNCKLGIDLGATNSCCYCIRPNGSTEVISLDNSKYLLPSIVGYKRDFPPQIASAARSFEDNGNRDYARNFKRLIGRKFDDPIVQEVSKYCGAPVMDRGDGYPCYDLSAVEEGMKKTPVEVATDILKYIIEKAKTFNETEIESICITIPARFDHNQRTATINALKNCGIDENRIKVISEPCAAALTYIKENPDYKEHILILDFGCGTFDVSIVRISNGGMCVEAHRGDNNIGGLTIDMKLVDWIKEQYYEKAGERIPDVRGRKNIASKLLTRAREMKESLSITDDATISLDGISVNGDAMDSDDDNEITITRLQFEKLIEDISARTQ